MESCRVVCSKQRSAGGGASRSFLGTEGRRRAAAGRSAVQGRSTRRESVEGLAN